MSVFWLSLTFPGSPPPAPLPAAPQLTHSHTLNSLNSQSGCTLMHLWKGFLFVMCAERRLKLFFISQIRAPTFENCISFSGCPVTAWVDRVRPEWLDELFPRSSCSHSRTAPLPLTDICLLPKGHRQILTRAKDAFPGSHFSPAF